ncbi:MAG: RecX family transcriptional regulator [Candidatus Omnitrophica bacterium]|nr:RecX family transcriptional regulator [Candidatus Omnitrophota bacterium]
MSSSKPEAKASFRAAVPRFLRSRVRSTREVLQALRRQGVSARAAARAVQAYQAQGLLDDRAAARLWADHWARQGYAAAAIRLKLSEKGFSDARIQTVTTRYYPSADDEARARTWLAQRSRSRAPRTPRARLARALASRGFDAELIERLLGDSTIEPDASA